MKSTIRFDIGLSFVSVGVLVSVVTGPAARTHRSAGRGGTKSRHDTPADPCPNAGNPLWIRGSEPDRCRWSMVGLSHVHHLHRPLADRRGAWTRWLRSPGVPHDRREAGAPRSGCPGSSPAPRPSGCASWPAPTTSPTTTGARSTAAWLADETRDAHGTVRRHSTLAAALDQRWTQTATAFAAGQVNLAQTRVIAEALRPCPPTSARTCWPRPRPCWSPKPPTSAHAS